MSHRSLAVPGTVLAAAALIITSAAPASAHAIVALDGAPAYAGKSSTITIELQHGCGGNQLGIDKVVARFGKEFGKITPRAVAGWTAKTKRTTDGRKVIWKLTGSVPAFNAPTYFRMKISWPKEPGVYGVPVIQRCNGEVVRWEIPDGPATADKPSPPLYPLPQIQVLPAR